MIIHFDSDNPKPLEQKVKELILKKLYIKVDDEKIFINKEDFIGLILKDIVAIAKANFDIDKALRIALKEQAAYHSVPDTKRNELDEALEGFFTEIDAYRFYLDGLVEEMEEDEIYMEVLSILNSETELLEKKLHELMMDSLRRKLSEVDANKMGANSWRRLDVFANQVKLIASNETIDEAVEEAYLEFDDYPSKHLVKKESIKKEFDRFIPLAKDEINAYKMALSMNYQNAEFPMILAMVKQLLMLQD